MIEMAAALALAGGVLSAVTSAVAAFASLRMAKRARPAEVEVRFPDGRRHLITGNLTGEALRKELAVVHREISEAVVEQRSTYSD